VTVLMYLTLHFYFLNLGMQFSFDYVHKLSCGLRHISRDRTQSPGALIRFPYSLGWHQMTRDDL
jgi:hypothetical protein